MEDTLFEKEILREFHHLRDRLSSRQIVLTFLGEKLKIA